jgi:iron complex outermembrane receptor protein
MNALAAYELGYRIQPAQGLTPSLATYYNNCQDLRSLEPVGTNSYVIANGLKGESWGVELSGTYLVTEWWRLRAGYNYLPTHIWLKPGGRDLNQGTAEGNDPQNQFSTQPMLDFSWHFKLDGILPYVDILPSPNVPSYFVMDIRLGWHSRPTLEFSIVGQNRWDEQKPKFGAADTRHEIPKPVSGKVTWRF